jgi:hypothetical protein
LGGRRFFRLLSDPLVGTAPTALTLHAIANNSVVIGGTPLLDTGTAVNVSSLPDHFFLRTIDQPANGGTFDGTVDVNLNAQTWAPIGSTGAVIWGNQTNAVGVWSIVSPAAIPEPSAVPLLVVLASVVGCWRRQRRFE